MVGNIRGLRSLRIIPLKSLIDGFKTSVVLTIAAVTIGTIIYCYFIKKKKKRSLQCWENVGKCQTRNLRESSTPHSTSYRHKYRESAAYLYLKT